MIKREANPTHSIYNRSSQNYFDLKQSQPTTVHSLRTWSAIHPLVNKRMFTLGVNFPPPLPQGEKSRVASNQFQTALPSVETEVATEAASVSYY